MKDRNEMHVIYETDDISQSKLAGNTNKNVSVVYHNPNVVIPPVLTLKINGNSYTKWNPEYVEYLKKKNPNISDEEIARCIKEAVANELSEKENISQLNSTDTGEAEISKSPIKR